MKRALSRQKPPHAEKLFCAQKANAAPRPRHVPSRRKSRSKATTRFSLPGALAGGSCRRHFRRPGRLTGAPPRRRGGAAHAALFSVKRRCLAGRTPSSCHDKFMFAISSGISFLLRLPKHRNIPGSEISAFHGIQRLVPMALSPAPASSQGHFSFTSTKKHYACPQLPPSRGRGL